MRLTIQNYIMNEMKKDKKLEDLLKSNEPFYIKFKDGNFTYNKKDGQIKFENSDDDLDYKYLMLTIMLIYSSEDYHNFFYIPRYNFEYMEIQELATEILEDFDWYLEVIEEALNEPELECIAFRFTDPSFREIEALGMFTILDLMPQIIIDLDLVREIMLEEDCPLSFAVTAWISEYLSCISHNYTLASTGFGDLI